MRSRPATAPFALVVLVAAGVAVALGWTSARHLDTLWDEQVDHDIAAGLLDHPLTGGQPTLDASQARLPMYANAIAFALTGRDDLAVSRAVSLGLAAVTLFVTALLGRLLFGPLVGALAAVLLALSPYFLSFARIAMTEGDVFFACFATLATYGFLRYLRRPTSSTWTAASILLGLALGTKVFAGFLLIVFGVLAGSADAPLAVDTVVRRRDVRRLHRLLAAGVAVILVTGALAWLARQASAEGDAVPSHAQRAALAGWGFLLGLWCVTIGFTLRRRALATGRLARSAGMTALALVTFFTLMPVHLLDHEIARTLIRRALRWDDAVPLALWSDHLRLYAGILLIKTTLPLGVLTAAALIFAAVRGRREDRWRPCVLAFVVCVACLCLLPLRQTFYLMGVYPQVMILTAAFAVHLGRWLRRLGRSVQSAWSVLFVCLLIHLASRHLGVTGDPAYPYYHLYGTGVVGDRWLGAESRGYRNLIQTPSDGVESLIRWCNTDPRVHRGDRVVSYLWEQAIVRTALPQAPHYVFVPRGISQASQAVPPAPSIDAADFVLVHINNRLGYGDRLPDWPPEAVLQRDFKVVHTVQRGPLEVAWVYARR